MEFFVRLGAVCLVAGLAACSPGPDAARVFLDDANSLVPGQPAPLPPAAQPEEEAPPTGDAPGEGACAFPHDRVIDVADGDALAGALAEATPGTLIRLQPGTYAGRFVARVPGTQAQPVIVCGPRDSVLDGGATDSGYVFHLDGADHWILSGFTLTNGKKGVVLDEADHVRLSGLLIHDIGEEAVRFRRFSSDNVLADSEIRDTGRYTPGYGEGVYIGTTVGQWEAMTGSAASPDRSDRNQVLNTRFGPGITAEHIDIKEGTTGGVVRNNAFDGQGISGANYADSWMDVKGNGYRIENNTGVDSPNDGFQVHVKAAGWGNDNVFAGNVASVNGPGYGFTIDEGSDGNLVLCDNQVTAAGSGVANVACAAMSAAEPPAGEAPPADGGLDGSRAPSENFDLTRWKITLPSGQDVQADELNSGYAYANVFYTDPATGGMVFKCPNLGGTTANSSYSRTELREMLAPGNTSARADENNWTTADGGTLTATLRVDHVSTTGDSGKVGRVVIGQIHGDDSEPIRLYFHQKPGEARGRIYAGFDTAANVNTYSPDIVGNTDGAGIALGEVFRYEIRLVDTRLTVVIRPASGPAATHVKDIDPAYRGENLYFKAGVYNQNNTGDSSDYVQATFFALTHTHP